MSLRAGLRGLLLLLPLLVAVPARAADIEVKSAWVNVTEGVFELHARTTYRADDRLKAALATGATINFDLQVVVDKQNRYWIDNTLVDVILRRELSWSGLSQSYVLKDSDSGTQEAYNTLDEALAAAGTVENWPVVVEPELDPRATYRIRVRAGYRRGSLPRPLRALMPWSDGWNRRSGWYAWILPR